jgi:hypothetical protein
VSDVDDKSKLTAFVLGELNVAEARELVKRMETDERLRREVEQLSALNAKVAAHYNLAGDDGPEFELSGRQLDKIRAAARREGLSRGWLTGFFLGGSFVAACAVAFVLAKFQPAPPDSAPIGRVGGLAPASPPEERLQASATTEAFADKKVAAPEAAKATPPTKAPAQPMPEARREAVAANEPPPPPPAVSEGARAEPMKKSLNVARKKGYGEAYSGVGAQSAATGAGEPVAAQAPAAPAAAAADVAAEAAPPMNKAAARMAAPAAKVDADASAGFYSSELLSSETTIAGAQDKTAVLGELAKQLNGNTNCLSRSLTQIKSGDKILIRARFSARGGIEFLVAKPALPDDVLACFKARLLSATGLSNMAMAISIKIK